MVVVAVAGCGDDAPPSVETCTPPPPQECVVDPTLFPNHEVFQTQTVIRIESVGELERFCETSCTRLEASLTIDIPLDEEQPRDLRAMRNLTYIQSFGVYRAQLDSLDGLNNVSEIRGLVVHNNSSLPNLTGLGALERVGSFSIENTGLESFDGLDSLREVDEDLYDRTTGLQTVIRANRELRSLQGLEGIEVFNGELDISGNHNLESLDGLDNMRTVQRLFVSFNDRLRNIEALGGLETAESIAVADNPQLPTCQAERVLSDVELTGSQELEPLLRIRDNSDECPE